VNKPSRPINTTRLLTAVLAAIASAATGADVSYYGVLKSIQFLQTNPAAAPVNVPSNGYAFTSLAVASTNNVLTNATVKAGSAAAVALAPTTNNTYWIYSQFFNSQPALDSAFPVGSTFSQTPYQMTLSTVHDGVHTAALNFFVIFTALTYPQAPQITNLAAAAAIDTTADFTVGWKPLSSGTIPLVEFSIMDLASNVWFTSPAPLSTGALGISSTSIVIPAYTLPPATKLIGHLTVGNAAIPDTSDYSGATGVAAVASDTEFPLNTRAAPAVPLLSVPTWTGGRPLVHLSGETNRIYQILTSTNASTWTNLFTTNCAAGAFSFTDTPPVGPLRLYRAKVGQ